MLEMICEELGVDIDTEWLGSNGKLYKINHSGFLQVYEEGQWWNDNPISYSSLFLGRLKPVWKPAIGEEYHIPDVTSMVEESRYYSSNWDNSPYDIYRFENNLVYRTKEEAIEVANKILELWKER